MVWSLVRCGRPADADDAAGRPRPPKRSVRWTLVNPRIRKVNVSHGAGIGMVIGQTEAAPVSAAPLQVPHGATLGRPVEITPHRSRPRTRLIPLDAKFAAVRVCRPTRASTCQPPSSHKRPPSRARVTPHPVAPSARLRFAPHLHGAHNWSGRCPVAPSADPANRRCEPLGGVESHGSAGRR